MRWVKQDISAAQVKELARRHEIDQLEAAILTRRGITRPEQLKFFLEDDLRWTHNPFLFTAMEDAVDRILLARDEEEKILVFGDRDVDGIASTVLLVETLQALGCKNVEWRIPLGDEPYGLSRRVVDDFAARDGTLIVCVDCGIGDAAEIAWAASLGVDVIVVDHHSSYQELPPALAIINPKVSGERYPFPHLAACAVTAKLCWALRFADTDWYNQSFCVLNATPGDGVLRVEAVKMVNLLETRRLQIDFRSSSTSHERERLASFLMGTEILVYGAPLQTSLLRSVFGRGVDIHLTDMAPVIGKTFPALQGVDMEGLRARSRMPRYQSEEPADLDILVSLLISYFYKSKPGLSQEYLRQLDLVALGTLADMMPLEDENRILVRQGMKVLNSTTRPGLRHLILQTRLGTQKLGAQDISWYLTPLINSTGRMGVPDKAVKLFLSRKEEDLMALAKEVAALNDDRRALTDQAWERFVEPARASAQRLKVLSLVMGEEIARGITGVLAIRLMNELNVPVVVISLAGEVAMGSVRSCRGFELRKFLEKFADIFLDYGGHAVAAGFQLEKHRLEDFLRRLEEVVGEFRLEGTDEEAVLPIDAELPASLFTPPVLQRVLDTLEPYGEGWPPLIFAVRQVLIKNMEAIGKDLRHLRLALETEGTGWSAVAWGSAHRLGKIPWVVGQKVDIAVQVQRSFYQGKENLQLVVKDLKDVS